MAPDDADPDADRGSAENQSVRPGSIVSNIDQRLDDIEGFQGEGQREERDINAPAAVDEPSAPAASSSSSSAAAASAAAASSAADAEAQYLHLLQQMQHRDLTPADLQLLMLLEQQRANSNLPPFDLSRAGVAPPAVVSGSAGPSVGAWCSPPAIPAEGGSSKSGKGGKAVASSSSSTGSGGE